MKQTGKNGSNPFVMGPQAVQRYFTTYSECAQLAAAQAATTSAPR
jgi:hypothetical protein